MTTSVKREKIIKVFMFMVALHSFIVGIVLLFIPANYLVKFGFNELNNNFFQLQGAVFHFVMAVSYMMVVLNPLRFKYLMLFSFYAKTIATIFLFVYFFFFDRIWVVFLSGFSDFSMAFIILFLYIKFSENKSKQ